MNQSSKDGVGRVKNGLYCDVHPCSQPVFVGCVHSVRTTVFESNGGESISRMWESDTYVSECRQDI